MFNYIKKFIRPLLRIYALLNAYIYDFNRYCCYSGLLRNSSENILTNITSTYHVIEKGLSFRESRYGFGQNVVDRLMKLMILYCQKGGDSSNSQYISAINVLKSYVQFHANNQKNDEANLSKLIERINQYLKLNSENTTGCGFDFSGGAKIISKKEVVSAGKGDFVLLSQNRYSIRTFSNVDVPMETIREVIKLAQKSPSTCNRQTTRIYVCSDKAKIDEILQFHGGARGFAEQINKLLLVAGDLNSCFSASDRMQVYIDPAIFAMNILYGLQYKGIGGCLLNWNVTGKKDRKLRKMININRNHTVVCMVAVGNLEENFKVAFSQRKLLNEILIETM